MESWGGTWEFVEVAFALQSGMGHAGVDGFLAGHCAS